MAIEAQFYQDNWVFCDNGSNNLFFTQQQKQQQQQFQMLQIQNQTQNQTLFDSNNNSALFCAPVSIDNEQSLYLEKQRQEIDQFLVLENERLRLALQEQRNRQVAEMMRDFELKTRIRLWHKDQEIAMAAKRTMELESLLVKLEMENQAWQRLAHKNEAMVVSLNHTLEQLKEQALCSAATADDAESCCGGGGDDVVCV